MHRNVLEAPFCHTARILPHCINPCCTPYSSCCFLRPPISLSIIRPLNTLSTAHTRNAIVRNSKLNTDLEPTKTSTLIRDHYVKELQKLRDGNFHNTFY